MSAPQMIAAVLGWLGLRDKISKLIIACAGVFMCRR